MGSRKIHKPKEDHYITFMIFTKSCKNYKTYRFAKWIFVPIFLILITSVSIIFNEVYSTYNNNYCQEKEINQLDETISELSNDISTKESYIASLEQTKQFYNEQFNSIKKQTEEFQQCLQTLNETQDTIEIKLNGTKKTTDNMPTNLKKSAEKTFNITTLSPEHAEETPPLYTDEPFTKKVSDLSFILKQSTTIVNNDLNYLTVLNKEADQMIPYWASYPSIMPVSGYISSPYGLRKNPTRSGYEFHKGIDIAGSLSTPIKATGNGTVIFSDYENGYGYNIVINHGYGLTTKYAHCQSNLAVNVGDIVKRGDIIAYRGNSGNSTGPHVHYEIRLYGNTKNPLNYIYTEEN